VKPPRFSHKDETSVAASDTISTLQTGKRNGKVATNEGSQRQLMLKTFQYRLYPTKKQARILFAHLEECRWLWNTLLAERKMAWEARQETIDYYDQKAELPVLKVADRPALKQVHSQVLQDVTLRLKRAFDAFFRRLKDGETPGYPRFRGPGRYDSLTYPQWGNGVALSATTTRLLVSKIGDVKIVYHRPLEGTPKTATIRRMPTGKWFVTIACEWEPTPLPPTGQEIGIDVGLKTFAACSNGQTIDNPRFFRTEERALASAQRKHQVALDAHKAVRKDVTERVQVAHPTLNEHAVWQEVSQDAEERAAWKERQRRRKVVARTHERVRWKREDFAHQHSRRIVNQYDLLAVEDLAVRKMMQNLHLAKSIHDAAWTQFATLIACKAAWADRRFITVDPAHTSQDCSGCGHRKSDLTLADRSYQCVSCGLSIGRDLNAALNILARGRACLASA
jgi:putative transposase